MQRFVTQFMGMTGDTFENVAYWPTEKQALGHVLMTVGSNPRIKAGRVFDQIAQEVVSKVYYGHPGVGGSDEDGTAEG